MKFTLVLFSAILIGSSCTHKALDKDMTDKLMIRMAEIEVFPEHLEQYLAILKEESAASVELEPGVISIYPMYQKEQPNQVRILEIYRDQAAYEAHLQTPHFKKYKTSTIEMVKGLKLVEMEAIDPESMGALFKKLNL